MATQITVTLGTGPATLSGKIAAKDRHAAVDSALDVFHEVELACTRFDPSSPLMRVNQSPDRWHRVPAVLFEALSQANRAYQRSSGLFDPRVLTDLVSFGYDRTLAFATGDVVTAPLPRRTRPLQRQAWRPRFRGATREVLLHEAVDLGGIGKGLAIRWASRRLASAAPNHLVEAGGDCYCAGNAPDGEKWLIGVEDPSGNSEPLAILALSDRAVTTSSIRLRRWTAGTQSVHHLIDPRTGQPGGAGLLAVSVVGNDPADAEVTSKVLFLAGSEHIAVAAQRRGIAAMWVDVLGGVGISTDMKRYVVWQP